MQTHLFSPTAVDTGGYFLRCFQCWARKAKQDLAAAPETALKVDVGQASGPVQGKRLVICFQACVPPLRAHCFMVVMSINFFDPPHVFAGRFQRYFELSKGF
jgi:hypothetical protein